MSKLDLGQDELPNAARKAQALVSNEENALQRGDVAR